MTGNESPKDPRPAAHLNSNLDRNLATYMAAAAAAGVALLAVSQAAQAKVIYTPANVTIEPRSTVPMDLNGDGTADFLFSMRFCGSHSTCLVILPQVAGNGMRGAGSNIAAGFFGVPVGGGEKFVTGTYPNVMALAGSYGSQTWSGGPWADVKNRYLGLKFTVNGQIHYGWARLSVKLHGGKAILTGYAYETTPGKTILEGHTSGPEKAANFTPAAQPLSLGMLASGYDALTIWRRDQQTTTR